MKWQAARPSVTGRSGPDDGREFAEHDIVPYHAPRTSAGKDRSDPALLLEVYEWIRDREDCGTVILGSGDADYQALVDRARVHGRRIVLCAFSQPVSRDMLAVAPFFPLEAELGIQLAEHGDVNVSLPAVSKESDTGIDDVLVRFVREMYKLEGRLSFVGYSMLCNQWMLEWGMAWNEHECRRLIDEYQEDRIAERHEVVNRNNPDWPTSAIRLIHTNDTVRLALVFSEAPTSNPVPGASMMPRGRSMPLLVGRIQWTSPASFSAVLDLLPRPAWVYCLSVDSSRSK